MASLASDTSSLPSITSSGATPHSNAQRAPRHRARGIAHGNLQQPEEATRNHAERSAVSCRQRANQPRYPHASHLASHRTHAQRENNAMTTSNSAHSSARAPSRPHAPAPPLPRPHHQRSRSLCASGIDPALLPRPTRHRRPQFFVVGTLAASITCNAKHTHVYI